MIFRLDTVVPINYCEPLNILQNSLCSSISKVEGISTLICSGHGCEEYKVTAVVEAVVPEGIIPILRMDRKHVMYVMLDVNRQGNGDPVVDEGLKESIKAADVGEFARIIVVLYHWQIFVLQQV